MHSTPSRSSEPSTLARMFARESPGSSVDMPTLVAITNPSRLPRAASQLPMMRSEPPTPAEPCRP